MINRHQVPQLDPLIASSTTNNAAPTTWWAFCLWGWRIDEGVITLMRAGILRDMSKFWDRIRSIFGGNKPAASSPAGKHCCAHQPQVPVQPDYPKDKTIRRVFIVEGCLICNACEAECPEVFRLAGSKPVAIMSSEVLPGSEQYFESHRERIEYVAAQCHVAVIGIEYTDGTFSPLGTTRGKAVSVAPELQGVPLELIQD